MVGTILPDVVMMDLPAINGIEAMKIPAQDPATSRIPAVARNANALAGDIGHVLREGLFCCRTKPAKIKELLDILNIAVEFSLSAPGRTTR